MAITCIVLDDEEMAIEHLLKFIDKFLFALAGYFNDPSEAITYLESNPVDLVFLDIEMPNFALMVWISLTSPR
jgi:two-component SAPR family response regulator